MNLHIISNKSKDIQRWVWRKRASLHPQEKIAVNQTKLLLVSGIACSGIDYLTHLLKKSLPSTDVYDGPLSGFTPRLSLNRDEDNLALDYSKTLPNDHPLFHVYDLLAHQSVSKFRLQQAYPGRGPRYCLIKETHALLGSEALLRTMKCKMLLIIDDPLSIVAQQVALHGIDSTYLKSEINAVQKPDFLTRFMRNSYKPVRRAFHHVKKISNTRERSIAEQILTVALIQHMFRILALRYPTQVTIVDRKDISRTPEQLQDALTFLTDNRSQESIERFIDEVSFMPYNRDNRVWQNSWPMSSITTGGLSSKELSQGFKMLKICGLYST